MTKLSNQLIKITEVHSLNVLLVENNCHTRPFLCGVGNFSSVSMVTLWPLLLATLCSTSNASSFLPLLSNHLHDSGISLEKKYMKTNVILNAYTLKSACSTVSSRRSTSDWRLCLNSVVSFVLMWSRTHTCTLKLNYY